MATFYSNTSNTYRLRYEVTPQAPDITNNRTTVKLELYIENGSQWMDQRLSAWMEANGSRQGTINDATWAIPAAQTSNRSTRLFSTSLVVPHNSDGTKTISLKAYLRPTIIYSWSPQTSLEINTTLALPTIPRTSTITTFDSFLTNATTVTATVHRASSAFTHDFILTVKNPTTWATVKTVTNVSTTANMALTTSQQYSVHSATPNSDKAQVRLTVKTYHNGTYIGETRKEVTATIPGTIVPSVSSLTVTDMTQSSANTGYYIKEVSRLKLKAVAYGGEGASIKDYRFSSTAFPLMSGPDSTQTMTNPLTTSGSRDIIVTVTDSRGRTASKTYSINILDYSKPKIEEIATYRASDSDGTPEPFGTDVIVRWKVTTSSVKAPSTSAEINTSQRAISTRDVSGDTWVPQDTLTFAPGQHNSSIFLSSTTTDLFPVNKEFNLNFEVSDRFNTVNVIRPIPIGQVPLSIGKEGIGAGLVTNDSYNLMVGDKGIHSKGGVTAPFVILPGGDVQNQIDSLSGGTADKLNISDTRSDIPTNNNPSSGVWFDFKRSNVLGLPADMGGNTSYSAHMTVQPWSDGSGGPLHALAFNELGMAYRQSDWNGTWGDWEKLWTDGAMVYTNGTQGSIKFPTGQQINYGYVSYPGRTNYIYITFPRAFSNRIGGMTANYVNTQSGYDPGVISNANWAAWTTSFHLASRTGTRVMVRAGDDNNPPVGAGSLYYFAIGY